MEFARWHKVRAFFIHLYTASGAIWGLLALDAIYRDAYQDAYLYMMLAVFIDGTDGPLARKFKVRTVLPTLDGSLLDNIVDYLNWTFVPILLLWKSNWLPEPGIFFCSIALLSSLYAFSHTAAKKKEEAMFRGFPSYWNFFVIYVALGLHSFGQWAVAAVTILLSILSVAPIYFIYPNRLKRFRMLHFVFGGSWFFSFVAMLFYYPSVPKVLFYYSLTYPAFYIAHSLLLNIKLHKQLSVQQ